MGLTPSKGNMYTWVTHTWNPIKGECPHGCTYCYMHRWGKQNPARLVEKEFKEFERDTKELGEGLFIFTGSSCDIFAQPIPLDWILDVLKFTHRFDNTYLFQSKNPMGIQVWEDLLPRNSRVCTTIETNRVYPQMGNTPSPMQRALGLSYITKAERYVTIEPIMDFDLPKLVDIIERCEPTQVNIGADSGNNNLPEPPKEKILELISALKEFTVIDEKRNLARLLK